MNITYLFGAGASYNAIPVVGELERAFDYLQILAEKQLGSEIRPTDSSDLAKGYRLFLEQLSQNSYRAKVFGTIDTYAKALSLTKNSEHDLSILKATLSLFFTIWQEHQIKNTDLASIREIKKHTFNSKGFQDIDSRYFGLLTNYLENKNEVISFKNNVKFLTWNYDTQLERALAVITGKSLQNTLSNFEIYPANNNVTLETPTIVHLNGISGFYESGESLVNLAKQNNPEGGLSIKKILEDNLYFINSTERQSVNPNNYFHFAWENNPIANKAREYAKKILEKTDRLVIIGYSFPNFNNAIDIELFDALKQDSKVDYRIIYQDINANKEIISRNFNIDKEKIEIENNNLNQFILPLERR